MFLLLFILWIIFNGSISLEICLFGIVIATGIFWFTCKYMDYSLNRELSNYKKLLLVFQYVFVLIWEIIKANISVIRLILTQKEEIEPVLATFQTDLESSTARAFFANAITLTPGTITVSLENSEYIVHCLDEEMAEGLTQMDLEKRLKEIER